MSYLKIGKYNGVSTSADTYQFKVTLDSEYDDVSSIRMWFTSVNFARVDYKFARDGGIMYMYNNGGFSAMTESDKVLLTKNFCVDKDSRDTVLTDAEQEQYWELFVYNSEAARQFRWNVAKSYISYRLSPEDSTDISEETDVLSTKYIRYGTESLAGDGKDGLYDWIKSEGNYTSTGFANNSYYTDELKDGLLDRLNGLITSEIQEMPVTKIVVPNELKKQ